MKKEMLRLRGVSADAVQSGRLNHIDFEISVGESIELVGGYNSGKSRLMDVISGAIVPETGTVFTFGRLSTWAELKKELVVKRLNRGFGLIGVMSVWENLVIHLDKKTGFPPLFSPAIISEQVSWLFQSYEIDIDVHSYVEDLSEAQKFMVSLIKTRLEMDDLVIVENFTYEFTANEIREVRQLINMLKAEGTSFIFSQVNVGWMWQLADRVSFIIEGQICWDSVIYSDNITDLVKILGELPSERDFPIKSRLTMEEPMISVSCPGASLSIPKGGYGAVIDYSGALISKLFSEKIHAISADERELRFNVRQIDFSTFIKGVSWMSLADNLCIGLGNRIGKHGYIPPSVKKYLTDKFLEWTDRQNISADADCSSFLMMDWLEISCYRLMIQRPELIIYKNLFLLGKEAQKRMLKVLSDMREMGTTILSVISTGNFSDYADCYYFADENNIESMTYEEIKNRISKAGWEY